MSAGATVAVTQTPLGVLSRRLPPDESIRQIRSLLLAGYGKGASEATITPVTRDRGTIGGRATSVRREQLAQQTGVARANAKGVLSRLSRGVRNLVVIGTGSVLVVVLVKVLRLSDPHVKPKRRTRS